MAKDEKGVAKTTETTPIRLIELAMKQSDIDVGKLEKLMAMQERWEANIARKDFLDSLSTFQRNCPVIVKSSKADFQGKSGGKITYHYADLAAIVEQIKVPLADCGLSYRFSFEEKEDNIIVCCDLNHRNGHTERTTFSAKSDPTGVKNEIQAKGSTLTYLQRYTLIGALGIATAQDDVDGQNQTDKDTLNADILKAIKNSNTSDELKMLWELNPELHGHKPFKIAIDLRLGEIRKPATDGKQN